MVSFFLPLIFRNPLYVFQLYYSRVCNSYINSVFISGSSYHGSHKLNKIRLPWKTLVKPRVGCIAHHCMKIRICLPHFFLGQWKFYATFYQLFCASWFLFSWGGFPIPYILGAAVKHISWFPFLASFPLPCFNPKYPICDVKSVDVMWSKQYLY